MKASVFFQGWEFQNCQHLVLLTVLCSLQWDFLLIESFQYFDIFTFVNGICEFISFFVVQKCPIFNYSAARYIHTVCWTDFRYIWHKITSHIACIQKGISSKKAKRKTWRIHWHKLVDWKGVGECVCSNEQRFEKARDSTPLSSPLSSPSALTWQHHSVSPEGHVWVKTMHFVSFLILSFVHTCGDQGAWRWRGWPRRGGRGQRGRCPARREWGGRSRPRRSAAWGRWPVAIQCSNTV